MRPRKPHRLACLGIAALSLAAVPLAHAAERFDGAGRVPISGLRGSLQNACWSPDDRRLAVTNWTRGYNRGPALLRVIPAAGGRLGRPLGPTGSDTVNMPGRCWDEATDRIVFSSDPVGRDQVFTIPAGGGKPSRVTRPPQWAIEPNFSPDGRWIAFESLVRSERRREIWKVGADGSGLQRLTSGADDRQPAWSPAGDRIVFQRQRRGQWDLHTIAPDGSSLRNVTRTAGLSETDPSFSPSGRWIVYSGEAADIEFASLFTIGSDGVARRRLTRTRGWYDGAPSWSHDGRRIAFEARPGAPDGSAGTRIYTIGAPPGRG